MGCTFFWSTQAPTMKMEGDKNSPLPAADTQHDGQTEGFNQPNKEERHATLSKHPKKHAHETVQTHTHTYTHSLLLPEKAAGVWL